MSWWEADPVAQAPAAAGGEWWKSDPPADDAAPPPGPGVNTTIRPASNIGKLFGSVENDISAAMQGTTPHVRKFDGSLNYEPLGELIEADQGPSFEGPNGEWVPVDPKQHVMLLDPQTNRQMVFKRDPAKEEGAITRVARMALPGLATVAPSRLAGGMATKAVDAAMEPLSDQAQLVAAAQRQGIPLPPAAVTDNTSLTSAAKKLSDVEYVGTPIRKGIAKTAKEVKEGLIGTDLAPGGVAGGYGGSRTLEDAGTAIQAGIENFGARRKQYPADRFSSVLQRPLGETGLRAKQNAAYGLVERALPPGASGTLDRTRLAIQDLMAKDAAAGVPLRAEGRLGDVFKAVNDPTLQLDFKGMQRLRTILRETKKSGDVKTVADHEIDTIYAALSADLNAMVANNGGPRAATMFKRADDLTRLGEERLQNVLRPLIGEKKSAESAAGTLLQWAQPGKQGNFANLQAVRRSVEPDTWNELASAAVYEMGRGRDGFSLIKLAGEYEKLTPKARDLLFRSGGNSVLADNLADLATISKSLKKVESFGNPSGSGKMAVSAAGGAGLMVDPVSTLSIIGGGRLAAHFLASRMLTNWLTGAARIQIAARTADPASLPQYQRLWVAHLGQLRAIGQQAPEIAPGLEKYAAALSGEAEQTSPEPQGMPLATQ